VRRRLWLAGLCLYAIAAVADGANRTLEVKRAGGNPLAPATLAVALCAGMFWPIDIVARPLLAPG
jgi:hypothetical protein